MRQLIFVLLVITFACNESANINGNYNSISGVPIAFFVLFSSMLALNMGMLDHRIYEEVKLDKKLMMNKSPDISVSLPKNQYFSLRRD
jgi:hypothetical protein